MIRGLRSTGEIMGKKLGFVLIVGVIAACLGVSAVAAANPTVRRPKPGDRCLVKYNKRYAAYHLKCVKGRLRRIPARLRLRHLRRRRPRRRPPKALVQTHFL
jgi:hypothetical protein